MHDGLKSFSPSYCQRRLALRNLTMYGSSTTRSWYCQEVQGCEQKQSAGAFQTDVSVDCAPSQNSQATKRSTNTSAGAFQTDVLLPSGAFQFGGGRRAVPRVQRAKVSLRAYGRQQLVVIPQCTRTLRWCTERWRTPQAVLSFRGPIGGQVTGTGRPFPNRASSKQGSTG